MRTLPFVVLAAASLFLAVPDGASAQEDNGRFGVGFQSSWPAYGLSGVYDVSEKVTAQAVVGAFGALSTLSGRGLYHFQRQESHSLYGFGTVGVWRHSWNFAGGSSSETSPGIGGGAGVEFDWRNILNGSGNGSDFPPIFSSIDIGFVAASFDNYNFSGLVIGAGLHYRF
jgi:hypothetical protein